MSDSSEFQKIIIPMIRKLMPALIAADIVGVQPMGGINYTYVLYKKYPKVETNMIVVHTSTRPFMRDDDPEPNDHYRPWLEENVGKQGVMWNWKVIDIVTGILAIEFANTGHASLFELRWP